MKKKTKNRIGWWLLVILIAGVAVLAGYFIGVERGLREGEKKVTLAVPPILKVSSEAITDPSPDPGTEIQELPEDKPEEEKALEKDYSCKELQEGILDFFKYLDTRGYVQKVDGPVVTYDLFKTLMMKVSSKPPIPAGEGISTLVMTENIYYFSRLLSKNDLRLIKGILKNESDSMELNINLFYNWITAGSRCPDKEKIRPSFEVTYAYAGFFLNTIGGRSYLFRRPSALRLLVSYYCLLIIHDADRRGANSYGIDILPEISQILRELKFYEDLLYQNEYMDRLAAIQAYYQGRR